MFEKLQAMISEKLGVEVDEVKATSSFTEDLGADSIDLFDVVSDIEEAFNISIENEDLENIKTVQDVMDYIEKKQA